MMLLRDCVDRTNRGHACGGMPSIEEEEREGRMLTCRTIAWNPHHPQKIYSAALQFILLILFFFVIQHLHGYCYSSSGELLFLAKFHIGLPVQVSHKKCASSSSLSSSLSFSFIPSTMLADQNPDSRSNKP